MRKENKGEEKSEPAPGPMEARLQIVLAEGHAEQDGPGLPEEEADVAKAVRKINSQATVLRSSLSERPSIEQLLNIKAFDVARLPAITAIDGESESGGNQSSFRERVRKRNQEKEAGD